MRLSGEVYSNVLGMDTGITVVTPNNLTEKRNLKTAYLLHGLCGNNKTWLDYSLLPMYAASGNTVYILPEAGRSFYTDMKYGQDWFTYIAQELPEICKNVFNISSEREDTIIMGGSMGGYGALKCALTYPERYGKCAAFSSGCLFVREELREAAKAGGMKEEFRKNFGNQLERDFIAMFGEKLECGAENDISELIERAREIKPLPELFITCGTRDYFYNDHRRFTEELSAKGIDFRYEEWEAYHDFEYFNEALRRAILNFGL